MRRYASRAELALLLLLSGDVHPNPGSLVRVGQLNCAGLTKEKRLSLLRRAADVDVLLLQELKMSEREAPSFTLPGFQGIANARNPNGGGVAVHHPDQSGQKWNHVLCGVCHRVHPALGDDAVRDLCVLSSGIAREYGRA